jgi:3-hydroxyacyl-CoA dehydrogenase
MPESTSRMSISSAPVRIQRNGAVVVATIDNPPVNALSLAVRRELLQMFEAAAADRSVSAIVLTGAGRDFVAGADIKEMEAPPVAPSLPDVILAMEACPQPILAAINGHALGGGFELALACDRRIAGPSAIVGLPEVKLGIIPGAGGTQRLPRLVGTAQAMALIAAGRRVVAKEAQSLGLVDDVVDRDLIAAATAQVAGLKKRRLSESSAPPSNATDVEKAANEATRAARGVPAVGKAVEMVRLAGTTNFSEGLRAERAAFLSLRESAEAKALRHLFFAERNAQKVPGLGDAKPRRIERAAVIGAGTMGSGIAIALADAGLPVALIERDAAAAESGLQRVHAIYDRLVVGGRLTQAVAEERFGRIACGADWSAIGAADLVIEAAFEDMEVKREVFRRLDELAPQGAILATNTSYLDVNLIAQATGRPQDVLGLHFFSPANVMRLLEIVRGAATAADVLQTGLALARRLGKVAVVAGVCEGFIGNRIFAAYRRQTEYLLEEGAYPEDIDRAIEDYGFAMGPFAVFDLTGLDIAWATRKRLAATRDPRQRYVAIADRLCEAGRFGRKTGRGWYLYPEGARRPVPDPEVRAIIEGESAAKGIKRRLVTADEIQRRAAAAMVDEAAKILAEGIAQRAGDIDLVLANGYGFPAFRGGPLFAADARGLPTVLADVAEMHRHSGASNEPAPLLQDLARAASSFAAWDASRAR